MATDPHEGDDFDEPTQCYCQAVNNPPCAFCTSPVEVGSPEHQAWEEATMAVVAAADAAREDPDAIVMAPDTLDAAKPSLRPPEGLLHVAHPSFSMNGVRVYTDVRLPRGKTWVKSVSDRRTISRFIEDIIREEILADEDAPESYQPVDPAIGPEVLAELKDRLSDALAWHKQDQSGWLNNLQQAEQERSTSRPLPMQLLPPSPIPPIDFSAIPDEAKQKAGLAYMAASARNSALAFAEMQEVRRKQQERLAHDPATALGHEEEPMPVDHGRESMHDKLIAEVGKRRDVGMARYNSTLQAFNGRNALRDVLDELVDASVYVMQLMAEDEIRRERMQQALRAELGKPSTGLVPEEVEQITQAALDAAFGEESGE